jgi:cell division protein FtsZ
MGDEVRVTVIAAGFDRWDDKKPKGEGRKAGGEAGARSNPADEVFATNGDDLGFDDDDDFDVPSFLK